MPVTAYRCDRGAAVVDFVLVSALVVALFAVVFQVGLALHVRNVLTALAAEGARFGANADVPLGDGQVEARTRAGITDAFNARFADRARIAVVPCAPAADGTCPTSSRGRAVAVRVTAPLPIALLYGGPVDLTVEGHALEESGG